MKWENEFICEECGAVNEMDSDICLSCGADLRKKTEKKAPQKTGAEGSLLWIILALTVLISVLLMKH